MCVNNFFIFVTSVSLFHILNYSVSYVHLICMYIMQKAGLVFSVAVEYVRVGLVVKGRRLLLYRVVDMVVNALLSPPLTVHRCLS